MPTTYKKTKDLKDSGIEWIRSIPRKWDIYSGQKFFVISKNKVKEGELEPLSAGYMGVVPQLENAAQNVSEGDRKHVLKGDIVLNSRSDRMGAVGISNYEGGVSLIYHVWRPKSKDIEPRYYHHLYRNIMFSQEYYRYGNGIVDDLWTTKDYALKRIIVTTPPLETQKRIADFLDEKTSKIDAVIEKKQKLIELLKEQRTSIITKAVTRGLDPKANMKDSGVEWIGEIPEGWEIKRLKFIFQLKNKKATVDTANKISLENIQGWTGAYVDTPNEYLDTGTLFSKDDILFGKLRPYLGKVMLAEGSGEGMGDILVYSPRKEKVMPKFGFYSFISFRFIDAINSHTYGVKMPRSNPLTIGSLPFVYPVKINEQQNIVTKIESELQNTNILIEKTSKQIKKLKEYRTSLIYNAVTGKISI